MQNKPEEAKRNAAFKRNLDLEGLLSHLNRNLNCAENKLISDLESDDEDYPLIFVMGPLRSGTTLFTQWLAATGIVAYPTNLLSRFYGAPLVGAQVQLMLTDPRYNFRDEIIDFNSKIDFSSENGKTQGALAPNEFWYFWRRFLPFGEVDWLPDEELHRVVDKEGLVAELTGLTKVFRKPFALKSMILNYNIPFLNDIFSKAIFVQIKRDPVANLLSILEARKRQFGDESHWYSFKIPEYESLKDLDSIHQSAGQLTYINRAVEIGMQKVDESRKLEVNYESFCDNPFIIFEQLQEKLTSVKSREYSGVKKFNISRQVTQNTLELQRALQAFQE